MSTSLRFSPISVKTVFLFLLLTFLFTSHVIVDAELSISRISSCVDNTVKLQQRKRRNTKVDKPLMINFGYAGVEAVSVLGPVIMKQINALADCVRLEASSTHYRMPKSEEELQDPTNKEITEDDHAFYKFYGGYNVTYLTGIISEVLPELEDMFHQYLLKALRRADWDDERRKFGVRSVYLLSGEKEGLETHLAELEKLQKELAPPKEGFFVLPAGHFDAQKAKQRERTQARQERLQFSLVDRPGTAYTAIALLTERPEGVGGHLAAKTTPSFIHADKYARWSLEEIEQHKQANDGTFPAFTDEYYDDEEGEEESSEDKALTTADNNNGKVHAEKIEELQMDKGSVFLMNSASRHGFEKLLFGKRVYLVMEFWHYDTIKDPQVLRGTIEQGEALGALSEDKPTKKKQRNSQSEERRNRRREL